MFRPDLLSQRVRDEVQDTDNEMYFSPVSVYEVALKLRKGRLDMAQSIAGNMAGQLTTMDYEELPIGSDAADIAAGFDADHADPWDRLLAAQAIVNDMHLVTADAKMTQFPVSLFW